MTRQPSRPLPVSSVLAAAILAAALLAAAPSPAVAQIGAGFGVRAGVSADPDQFHFGLHYDTGPLVERLSFRPNVEVGLGNDVTTVAANFEFAYWFPLRRRPWGVYAGGGPSLVVFRYDDRLGGGTDAQPGFNLLVGIAHSRGFFTEAKLGLIDSPEAKFTVGYTWR
jgi:hypothetical protein